MRVDVDVDETDERFAFGENWRDFSKNITEDQLQGARKGVESLLGTSDLRGKSFLDIGCGSGLMSVAAHQMGARVAAFDFDQTSVATSMALRDAVVGKDAFEILRGSVLDRDFVNGLGQYDIVYSWGVLHHTGNLWGACEAVVDAVASDGALALAIYNDQGLPSRLWKNIKHAYVAGGPVRRRALLAGCHAYFSSRDIVGRVGRQTNAPRPRGMDRRHDLVDWVGGYPFEVAKPEEVFGFFKCRGFQLERLTTCRGGLGCNEFLFQKGTAETRGT